MAKSTKYNLSFTTSKTKFIVSYYNGQLKRLEYKSGGVKDDQWKHIGLIVPFAEHLIFNIEEKYQGRVIYQKQDENNPASQYKEFMGVYFRFFERETKLKPKVNAAEGAALKQIIAYLNENSTTEEEALKTWMQLLGGWHNLEDFYKKQMQLKQINSNLTTVLMAFKQPASKYPSKWSRNYEKTLSPADMQEYWKHLRSLGYQPVKDGQGRVYEWKK